MKKLNLLFALLIACQFSTLAADKTLLEYKIEQQNQKIDELNKIIEDNKEQFGRQEWLIRDLYKKNDDNQVLFNKKIRSRSKSWAR